MKRLAKYLGFIKEHGRPLSTINPGSDEFALILSDALLALDLLKNNHKAILGADILTEKEDGELGYILHNWGYDYHYLNWYCERNSDESEADYALRSYEVAKSGINAANETAQKLRSKCYVVLVVGSC